MLHNGRRTTKGWDKFCSDPLKVIAFSSARVPDNGERARPCDIVAVSIGLEHDWIACGLIHASQVIVIQSALAFGCVVRDAE
jgi:hypothetical protein